MEMKLSIIALVFSTVEAFTRGWFPQLSKRVLRVAPANLSLYKLDSFSGISNHAICAKYCKSEPCFAFSYTTDSKCETYLRIFEVSTHAEISQSTLYFNKVIINSCAELIGSSSGVHKIGKDGPIVYCDMDTEDGPWTVIQRRTKGDVDFYRQWSDYKNGSGDVNGDFWLGNDNLHLLTNMSTILRVEVEALTGERGYAEYSNFQVADESQNYKLLVNGFSGNITYDAMAYSNNCQFTTMDRDNDKWSGHCGPYTKSGWWHNQCVEAQLNGIYRKTVVDNHVMRWSYFPDPNDAIVVSNNCQFTTLEKDNDKWYQHCGLYTKSVWCHNQCVNVQLNGIDRKSVVDRQVMRRSYFPDPCVIYQPLKQTKIII